VVIAAFETANGNLSNYIDEIILKVFYLSKRLKNINIAILNICNCLKEVINELENTK